MNIKMEITQNEIKFCELMEKMYQHQYSVNYSEMIEAGNLVGIPINTSCRSCAQKSGVDLLNRWGQLKPSYNEWFKQNSILASYIKNGVGKGTPPPTMDDSVPEITARIVEQEVKEIVIADELPLLEGYTEIGKTPEYRKLDQERSLEFDKEIKSKIKKK